MRDALAREIVFVTLAVEGRGDGGLQVTSRDVPGVYLSGRDGDRIWRLVPETVKHLLRVNRGMDVVGVLAPPLPPTPFPEHVPIEVEVAVQLAVAA